eukprot:g1997.t1
MVKFGDNLAKQKFAEWDRFYIDYDTLKRKLYTGNYRNLQKESPFQSPVLSRRRRPLLESEPIPAHTTISAQEIFAAYLSEITASPAPSAWASSSGGDSDASSPSSPSGRAVVMFTSGNDSKDDDVSENDCKDEDGLLSDDAARTIMTTVTKVTLPCSDIQRESRFRHSLLKGINVVERFYCRKLEELRAGFRVVQSQVVPGNVTGDIDMLDASDQPNPEVLTAESLKRAFSELQTRALRLQNFAVMNYTATLKILKKHDKVTLEHFEPIMSASVEAVSEHRQFMVHSALNDLLQDIEREYARAFTDGTVALARAELRMNALPERYQRTFGFGAGCLFLLTLWVLWDFVIDMLILKTSLVSDQFYNSTRTTAAQATLAWVTYEFPVYRGLAYVNFWMWTWAASLYVWNRSRINFIYMFALDPRIAGTHDHRAAFKTATWHTMVLMTCFLLHTKLISGRFILGSFNPGWLTLFIFVYSFVCAIFPTRQNRFMWRSLLGAALPCCYTVTFLYNFVGDVLTSLTKPLTDLAYGICYTYSGVFIKTDIEDMSGCESSEVLIWAKRVILITPYLIRFAQCLSRLSSDLSSTTTSMTSSKNFYNALKYAFAMLVTIFGIFSHLKGGSPGSQHWTFVSASFYIVYATSTLYTYSWDIIMDWNLYPFNPDTGRYELRKNRMFVQQWVYHAAAVADLLLRFLWSYTLLPEASEKSLLLGKQGVLSGIAPIAEIFRRCIWGFFRLENEHLNNTAGYRRVTEIPLHVPLMVYKKKTSGVEKRGRIEVAIVAIVVFILGLLSVIIGSRVAH